MKKVTARQAGLKSVQNDMKARGEQITTKKKTNQCVLCSVCHEPFHSSDIVDGKCAGCR